MISPSKTALEALLRAVLAASPATLGRESVFVFQPGAPNPAPPVYSSFPALYTQWSRVPGPKVLQVDTSFNGFNPAVIPAGTWNLDGATLTAKNEDTLSFADGAHLDPTMLLLTLRAGITVSADGTTPVWNPSNSFALLLVLEESTLQGTTAPFFRASSGISALSVQITQDAFFGDGTHSVITVDAGSKIDILPHSGATLSAHAIVGLGDADVHTSSDVDLQLPQGVSTLTITHASLASLTAYTPAVLANWSNTAPTDLANALDRIAAKIGPIP